MSVRGGEEDRRTGSCHGIPSRDVVVDPLVMPIGAMDGWKPGVPSHPEVARQLRVNTTCGASTSASASPTGMDQRRLPGDGVVPA